VSGETEEQAVWTLKQAGFAVQSECCEKSRYEKGRVVFTQPGASELTPKGSVVAYMLSKPRWPTWLLIIGGLATLAVVAVLSWLAIPKRPRISVRLPETPTAGVTWGDPIAPEVEVTMPPITSNVEFPPYKERDR
jgi:hypothetical protein